MRNKQIVIGLAAAAAAIVIAGRIISSRRKMSNEDDGSDVRRNFKGKLSHLQRKAQKEYRQAMVEGDEFTNTAKDRVNQWVDQSHH